MTIFMNVKIYHIENIALHSLKKRSLSSKPDYRGGGQSPIVANLRKKLTIPFFEKAVPAPKTAAPAALKNGSGDEVPYART
jgi:hypothetical protein